MNKMVGFRLCLLMGAFVWCACQDSGEDNESQVENTEAACQDSVDNDRDGQVDCKDSDCARWDVCQHSGDQGSDVPGNNNGSGSGDNGSGSGDNGSGSGDNGGKPDDGMPASPEDSEAACSDGVDNDKDGAVDCLDDGCDTTLWCQLYTTTDTGVAGVRVVPTQGLVTSEDGDEAVFAVVLTSKPDTEVTILAESSNETEGMTVTADGGRGVTFNATNWNRPQYFTIQGQDDDAKDGDTTYQVYIEVYSDSKAWEGVSVEDLTVVNTDNETPTTPASFVLDADALEIWETGIGASFTLRPGTKPVADVTVHLSASDDSEMTVSPQTVTFSPDGFRDAQAIVVRGVSDKIKDGDQRATVRFTVSSADDRFDGYVLEGVPVVIHDVDTQSTGKVRLRFMAANTTSGNYQSYDGGEGARIFMAVKPDIALIQEFKVNEGSLEDFVRRTFGAEYSYAQGTGNIPNGIVSRYPILETGSWHGENLPDRRHEWARIDIPGNRELLAISVHLHTDYDNQNVNMREIRDAVKTMLASTNDYVVLGGDFNTSSRDMVKSILSGQFETGTPYPVDQNDVEGTSFDRKRPLDWVLVDHDLQQYRVDTVIGGNRYAGGHVFDARVYEALGTLATVPPVQSGDSGPDASVSNNTSNIQHMAVIRDFELAVD